MPGEPCAVHNHLLQQRTEEFRKISEEFQEIKADVKSDFDSLREELREVTKAIVMLTSAQKHYEQLRTEIDEIWKKINHLAESSQKLQADFDKTCAMVKIDVSKTQQDLNAAHNSNREIIKMLKDQDTQLTKITAKASFAAWLATGIPAFILGLLWVLERLLHVKLF